MAVYEILEEIINEKHLSIADVARICNLPDSTVRGIIRRKQETIALEVAFKLSEGLDVSLEKLNGMPEKEIKQKNTPSTAEAAPGEELRQEIIHLAGKLSAEQKDLFIALLRLTAARNQGLSAADLVSAGEAALKSERQNPTK